MSGLLTVGDYIELVLNIIEAITIIVTVSTFLYLMLNKFLKGIKGIFSELGLPFIQRIRVLFLCRKSFHKKRTFMEFAILKTQGLRKSRKEWRRIINEFKDYYNQGGGKYTYNINNCTFLLTDEFSAVNKKYFDFINKPEIKKIFSGEGKVSWIIKIIIKDAYVTPTCLISGLLSEYKENWEEFIKRYVSVAFMKSSLENNSVNKVLTEELYFTFAWLLWGPSFEISYKKYWGGLAQLSFGDESNSIPAIFSRNGDNIESIRKIFIENSDKKYGELISPTITLNEKNKFYDEASSFMNPHNAYFYQKTRDNHLSFVASIDDYEVVKGFKADKYYCTAYVWILFELESDDAKLHPENLVAFFEHSNLADAHTYNFLLSTLIDKAFAHFRKIFQDPALSDRKYRFICSFNNVVTEKFIERYNSIIKEESGKVFKERLFIEPKRSGPETFEEIDDFFYEGSDVTFQEIDKNDKESLCDLFEFYTKIYEESFPKDERESFENILYYLKKNTPQDKYRYHITIARNGDNKIIGGAIYDYFSSINSGAIEFIVVTKDNQSAGIGTRIYNHIVKVLSIDSHEFGYNSLNRIYCEIDSPSATSNKEKKYLYFWNKNNYKRLDFNYIQPSLSNDKNSVDGLWLVTSNISAKEYEVKKEELIEFLRCYLAYCMQIDNPDENEIFIKMKKDIESRDKVVTKNIF